MFSQWVRAQFVLGFAVGVFTFIGLLVLSRFVDPIFGRYAVLLSVIAGRPRAPADHRPDHRGGARGAARGDRRAGAGRSRRSILYTLVQQVENNFLVPKIQGDAVELHPAAVMFAIIIGGALGGLLGAILALPVAAAVRDVVRYLFRRVGPTRTRPGSRRSSAGRHGARIGRSNRPWMRPCRRSRDADA